LSLRVAQVEIAQRAALLALAAHRVLVAALPAHPTAHATTEGRLRLVLSLRCVRRLRRSRRSDEREETGERHDLQESAYHQNFSLTKNRSKLRARRADPPAAARPCGRRRAHSREIARLRFQTL
jgi:hypothetical protein